MLRAGSLILRYSAFAAVATVTNILTQEASLSVYHGNKALEASILAGTGMGFAVKYVLDKYWIFFDRTSGSSAEVWKILLYGLSGVLTTALFWAVEIGCWKASGTDFAKYSGAVVGLGIGYVMKYLLDRRFVFVRAPRHADFRLG